MLQKIINTLKDGDSKTKGYLITIFVLWVVTAGVFVGAFLSGNPLFWMAAFATLLITYAVTKNLNFTTTTGGGKKGKKKSKGKTNAGAEKSKSATSTQPDEGGDEAVADGEEDADSVIKNMTEEKLKQLFITYKVKKEHVPVIIDLCASERLKQCPGFAWMDDYALKILVIDSKPRMIERDTSRMRSYTVERGISVRASQEYAALRDSELMKRVFTPYLPRYHKKEISGRIVLLKNLYVLDEDIKFTSGCVSQLMKILPMDIELNDRRLQESAASKYYKELFRFSFLWKDGIYTLEQYKEFLEQLLKEMAYEDISYSEFENNLSEMISDGLLPMEYRDYAYKMREKKNAPPQEEKKGLFGKKKK